MIHNFLSLPGITRFSYVQKTEDVNYSTHQPDYTQVQRAAALAKFIFLVSYQKSEEHEQWSR